MVLCPPPPNTQVEFPAKPTVSAEAKAFLQHCLAYSQADRWDVLTAAADPYLQLRRALQLVQARNPEACSCDIFQLKCGGILQRALGRRYTHTNLA